jgi:hypothetical protein
MPGVDFQLDGVSPYQEIGDAISLILNTSAIS